MNLQSRLILYPIAAALGMLLAITFGNAHEIDQTDAQMNTETGSKLVSDSGYQSHIDALASRANAGLRSTATYEHNFGPSAYEYGVLHGNTKPTGDPSISRACSQCHSSN